METMPVKNPLGRPPKFSPQQLADKFAEYVEWSNQNPYYDNSRVEYKNGNFAATSATKPRRISIGGFLLYIGCIESWWSQLDNSKDGEDFLKVKEYIKNYCEQAQVNMASAGLLKENIISRLLGLADKKTISGDGVKIVVESPDEKDKIENIGELGI